MNSLTMLKRVMAFSLLATQQSVSRSLFTSSLAMMTLPKKKLFPSSKFLLASISSSVDPKEDVVGKQKKRMPVTILSGFLGNILVEV